MKGGPEKIKKAQVDKIIEDKTFGMKSKKSKKVQGLIKQTEAAVLGKEFKKQQEQKEQKKKEKKKQQEEAFLLGFLQKNLGKDKKKEGGEGAAGGDEEAKYDADSKTASINIYVDPREADPKRSAKV